MVMAACRKSDNERVPELTKVPLPLLKKVSGNATISVLEADKFTATFSVGLYYPDADKPAKFDVVVRKNSNNATTKVIKADVTTYPSEVTVTGPQLISLFGNTAIKLGDKFDFGVDVTLSDGKKFLAFPTVGVPFSSGGASVAGSAPSIAYEAVCAFKMSDYGAIGSTVDFVIASDAWGDYVKGDVIPVKIIDETSLSFEYPANNAKPIVIKIDPVTNVTSVAQVTFGDYGLPQYGDFITKSKAGSAGNTVTPCETGVSVELEFTSSKGFSFQGGVIKFNKK